MVRTLILYESRYGFTEKIAKNLSLILGPAKCCRVSEYKGAGDSFDAVVICTPIYLDTVDSRILDFVSNNIKWLTKKKVVLICTSLVKSAAEHYLKPLKNILGQSVVLQGAVSGELIIEKLNSLDFSLMKEFSAKTGFPLKDCNLFDKNEFAKLALNIKELKDKEGKIIENKTLESYVVEFIKNHNTCTLATGHGENVRATPIEYTFKDQYIYLLSEGGEKFLNLLFNPKVSICIYDEYKNMNELGGMQITGEAEIIAIGSGEYISLLKYKKINYEKLAALPVDLNMIKVKIKKIEFLWSEFTRLGFDAKQTLYYGRES